MQKLKKFFIIPAVVFSLILSSCGEETREVFSAREIAEAVLDSAEFPKMVELTEKEELTQYIDLDYSYVEDVCFYWQLISVQLAEVLIIVPKKGMEQEALNFANARRDKIMNDTVFYPSQEEAAEASVSGIIGNTVYFICGNEAGKAEDFLKEMLK